MSDLSFDSFQFSRTLRSSSILNVNTGHRLLLQTFQIEEQNASTKLDLFLYANGCRQDHKNKLCFGLCLRESDTEVYAEGNISILGDNQMTVLQKKFYSNFFKITANGLLIHFNTDLKSVIFHNKLVISCKVDINMNETNLGNDLKNLLNCADSYDVRFVVAEGHELPAHKVILAARSSVFAEMLQDSKESKEVHIISIADIDKQLMSEILNFIYADEAPNLNRMVFELLPAAHKYHLQKLKLMCAHHLSQSLSSANAEQILKAANTYGLCQLRGQALDFIEEKK